MTDEQKERAIGWAESEIRWQEGFKFKKDTYLDILKTIRSALEPKVVTISEVRELLSCYRHVHSVDIYKLDEAQERAVIKKLAELGIAVKEENK